MTSTDHFVSELITAANQVEKLTAFETTRLLDRAASTIEGLQSRADNDTIASPEQRDIVSELRNLAARAFSRTPDEIADAILTAVAAIKAARINKSSETSRP